MSLEVGRRDFLKATIGFLACPVLSLEETKAAEKIIEPPSLRRSQPPWAKKDERCPHDFPEGYFYLAQDESQTARLLGTEFKFRIAEYREKVERIGHNPYSRFVSYDTNCPEFQSIRDHAKRHMHMVARYGHNYAEVARVAAPLDFDGKGTCIWGIEPLIEIEGVEGHVRWMLVGRKGLTVVVNVPKDRWFISRINKIRLSPESDRYWYNSQILNLNREPMSELFGWV